MADREHTIDSYLTRVAGEFGAGQHRHYVIVTGAWIPCAFVTLSMVLVNKSPAWQLLDDTGATIGLASTRTIPCTEDFVLVDATSSIGGTWSLVCSDGAIQGLINTLYFVGFGVGASYFGWLADRIGRKPANRFACAVGGLATLASSRVDHPLLYIVLRTLAGVGVGGLGTGSYVLASEVIGPSWQGVTGVAQSGIFALGGVLLVPVALVLTEWRSLTAATGCSPSSLARPPPAAHRRPPPPATSACLCHTNVPRWVTPRQCAALAVRRLPLLAYIFVYSLVDESPRWLHANGRSDEAAAVLFRLAVRNGAAPPTERPPVLLGSAVKPASQRRLCVTSSSSSPAFAHARLDDEGADVGASLAGAAKSFVCATDASAGGTRPLSPLSPRTPACALAVPGQARIQSTLVPPLKSAPRRASGLVALVGSAAMRRRSGAMLFWRASAIPLPLLPFGTDHTRPSQYHPPHSQPPPPPPELMLTTRGIAMAAGSPSAFRISGCSSTRAISVAIFLPISSSAALWSSHRVPKPAGTQPQPIRTSPPPSPPRTHTHIHPPTHRPTRPPTRRPTHPRPIHTCIPICPRPTRFLRGRRSGFGWLRRRALCRRRYALAAMLLDRIGRKRTLTLSFAVGGLACLACAFLPAGTPTVAAAMGGRFFVSAAFGVVFVFTTELFPTVLRNAAMGLCSAAARAGAGSAPQVGELRVKLVALAHNRTAHNRASGSRCMPLLPRPP